MTDTLFKITIVYLSYLSFPFLGMVLFWLWKNKTHFGDRKIMTLFMAGLMILSLFFIYARFIERYLINIQTTQIETGFSARIIVIADMHLGIYKGTGFMERVIEKINQQEDVDAIVIPGDFTYYPKKEALSELFAPLKKLNYSTYAVLGNHDSEKPGPPIQEALQKVLEENGVVFLHNTSAIIPDTNIHVLGLGDNWARQDDIEKINDYQKSDNLIVLTHNPDTTLAYQNNIPDITIAGHTHGGQIRIPWLYKKLIPTVGDFDQGLYETKTGKVFVTSGLGEVGLPMRLGVRPVIDILEFY